MRKNAEKIDVNFHRTGTLRPELGCIDVPFPQKKPMIEICFEGRGGLSQDSGEYATLETQAGYLHQISLCQWNKGLT